MIATDHDGRPHLARANKLVDRETCSRAIPVAEPANARRKALEGDAPGSQLEPALERSVIREESAERLIDRGDVRLITGEGRPPERSDALAEQRPDIGRDEARVCERLLYAARIGLTS